MAKVSYTTLKLKTNTDVNTFEFNGKTIEVLQYLPAADKYDLIMVTLQQAEENGIYNDFKLDVFFHLNLVYMYSNLTFTDKQREDELKLYDALNSSGFMANFIEAMDENEYNACFETIESIAQNMMEYKSTAGAVLQSLINDLPRNAAAAAQFVDGFDPEKFKAVKAFAEAANGNRPIPASTGKVVSIE